MFAYGSCSLSASQLEVETHGTPVWLLKQLANSIQADTLFSVAEKELSWCPFIHPDPLFETVCLSFFPL